MEDIYRSQFRIPYSLYELLKASADENRRSVNAELISRLESSFSKRDLVRHKLGLPLAEEPEEQAGTIATAIHKEEQVIQDELISESQSAIIRDQLVEITSSAKQARYETETIQYLCAVLALQSACPGVLTDTQREQITKVIQNIADSDSEDPTEIMGLLANRLFGRSFTDELGI